MPLPPPSLHHHHFIKAPADDYKPHNTHERGPNDVFVIWALVFVFLSILSFFFTNLCFSFLLLLFLGFDNGITQKWLHWQCYNFIDKLITNQAYLISHLFSEFSVNSFLHRLSLLKEVQKFVLLRQRKMSKIEKKSAKY